MSVQENIASVATARAKLVSHCLCLKLDEDESSVFVYLPKGYVFDAVRVRVGEGGKSRAMEVAEGAARKGVER